MSVAGDAARSRLLVGEPRFVRYTLVALALGFVGLVLGVPLGSVLVEAFSDGVGAYWQAVSSGETLSAVRLTMLAALVSVPLNAVFGLAAAWCLTKFSFRGKNLILTLIDLPFAVSPVVSGMIYVLLLGARTPIGGFLDDHGIKIIFAAPGIVLATTFVTFPIVARELVAYMQGAGVEEEEAALVLGASGWQTFFRITLPNAKWALLYGLVLCNARAMGEFGAVSVVSGHVRGETNTLPLHVEMLYGEYHFSAAFAVASLLTLLGVVTMIVKRIVERKKQGQGRPVVAA